MTRVALLAVLAALVMVVVRRRRAQDHAGPEPAHAPVAMSVGPDAPDLAPPPEDSEPEAEPESEPAERSR
ncbi:MAG TPA: hypothetical protein VH914_15915 [Acidimicrobiia bacterium]|jgi:hypothetical protein|nr:hypothetical protein [Acidimicrobiia bacterium]